MEKGKIEMYAATPADIEMAIMFLYGKKPKLTRENIEHMMYLAEFLLIPNLKSACICWLNKVTITEENCLKLIQLASIYDYEVPECDEYIVGHMLEMLPHAQMVRLSRDSVQYLFSDSRLSYVSMDDKVQFLIRWANYQPTRKQNCIKELFELIDFHEVSTTVLDELKAHQNISEEIDFEKILRNVEKDIPHSNRILIMKGENNDGTFWCLDLEREKWFRIKPETNTEGSSYHNIEMSGAINDNSEIYFVQSNNNKSNVLLLNLEEDTCKKYQLVLEENGNDLGTFHGVCVIGNICIAYENKIMGLNKPTRTGAMDFKRNETTMVGTDTSTLYMGYIKDERIKMSPLLTFKNYQISKICINKMLTIAMLGSGKVLSLFNLVDYKIDRIRLNTEYNDKLVQSDEGFVIYNNQRCLCLTRKSGPSLSSKFLTNTISMNMQGFYIDKYFFCGNNWYRYYYRRDENGFVFESASLNDIISQRSFEDVVWYALPLPKESEKCHSTTIKENSFEICLPETKLRCIIECPHCIVKPKGTIQRPLSVSSNSDDSSSDDSLNADSSDDNCYGLTFSDDDNCYGSTYSDDDNCYGSTYSDDDNYEPDYSNYDFWYDFYSDHSVNRQWKGT